MAQRGACQHDLLLCVCGLLTDHHSVLARWVPSTCPATKFGWSANVALAALRIDRIDAPWLLDGPINGESFLAYVENELVPTLKSGDVVVADNLASHRRKAVRTAIRRTGARLVLLPKYSPDLNPIEQVFAKLKHLFRKASARSREAVCAAIGELLTTYTPAECANYFRNSGYGAV